jgi:ABC-type lipoprotein release transport system permease subunit
VGDPNLDDRVAFMHAATLNGMLGTEGPNEIVILLDEFEQIERVRGEVASVVASREGVVVHSWDERNPALANMIDMGQGGQYVFAMILLFLVTLTVVNTTMMSVLERTREFGVMLALGFRSWKLVRLVMTEVGLLGVMSVTAGAIIAAGIELYGRVYGFDMTSVYDAETLASMEVSGVSYDLVYYASMPAYLAMYLLAFAYTMFLLAGLGPALRSGRFKAVDAMKEQAH